MKKQVKLYVTIDGGGAGGRQRRNAVRRGGRSTVVVFAECRKQVETQLRDR